MSIDTTTLEQARRLISEKDFGVLSTTSVHLDGFPFGSIVTYTVDYKGHPLMLISSIAQHTKNVTADSRCSLTILENAGGNVQAEARITISGHLEVAESDPDAMGRYERYFPESIGYRKAHDFVLYRLRPTMLRFIGGFGNIHWIEPSELFLPSPFDSKSETYIIDHMNSDHEASLRGYFEHFKDLTFSADQEVKMCGIDSMGFDVKLGSRTCRFHSPRPITDTQVAREILVDMAKESRAST